MCIKCFLSIWMRPLNETGAGRDDGQRHAQEILCEYNQIAEVGILFLWCLFNRFRENKEFGRLWYTNSAFQRSGSESTIPIQTRGDAHCKYLRKSWFEFRGRWLWTQGTRTLMYYNEWKNVLKMIDRYRRQCPMSLDLLIDWSQSHALISSLERTSYPTVLSSELSVWVMTCQSLYWRLS